MAAEKKTGIIIKKKWVPIRASKLFSEQVIGESLVPDVNVLVGRKVSVSLMTLTGDPQKQSVNVTFKITGVANDAAQSELTAYKILPAAAKKFMRRRREKIEDSFIVETQDKVAVRIKPVIVTRGRTTGSILATMQKLSRAYLAKVMSTMTSEQFIREVVERKLQHGLASQLHKLYPIAICEVRQFEFIPAEKVKELGLKVMLPPENLPDLTRKAKEEVKEEAKEETKEEAPQEQEASENA